MCRNTMQKDVNATNYQSLQQYCLVAENYLISKKKMFSFSNIQTQYTTGKLKAVYRGEAN